MNDRPANPSLARRFRFAWRMLKALRAEHRGDFDRALHLVDGAAAILPLRASDRVWRAMLLLRAQRIGDAQKAFGALRDEFKASDNPDLRYLRHFCTYQMAAIMPSDQWAYEAKQAKLTPCREYLKRRFPMVTTDEIFERIQPRR